MANIKGKTMSKEMGNLMLRNYKQLSRKYQSLIKQLVD